jgi:hypothetical protein
MTAIQIPKSVQAEHREIRSALEDATSVAGAVGTAAQALARVLEPHFVREEEIALPPLAWLAPLAAGELPSGTAEILGMTDALRRELPRMLDEHTQIRAAVEKLRLAARSARATRVEQLAEQLALHAQTEEEVLYPAAVLVGDIIRARLAATRTAPAPPLAEAVAPPPAKPVVKSPSAKPAVPPPPVVKTPPAAPTLDLQALEAQLKATSSIGFFTKIALKNQVDDLLDQFREYYGGGQAVTMTGLRRSYDLLMMKVLSLLQDKDPALAADIVSSREAIWGLLADPKTFATLEA